MKTYICKKCNVNINAVNMYNKTTCIECYNEYHNNWQKNNKEKINKYRMNNYNKNKKLIKTYSRNGKMSIQIEKFNTNDAIKQFLEYQNKQIKKEKKRKANNERLI